MKVSTVLETPGFVEAIQEERLLRDLAFLLNRERIGDFEVCPITLRNYSELRLAQSPFIPPFRTPSPESLAQFLWRLSPEFQRPEVGSRKSEVGGQKSAIRSLISVLRPPARAKRDFHRRCLRFVQPPKPRWASLLPAPCSRALLRRWSTSSFNHLADFAHHVQAARDFVEESLMDKPSGGAGSGPEFYADACGICAALGRNYHHFPNEDAIMDLPLKKVFQYLREIREHHCLKNGVRPALDNPRSDKAVAAYLAALNKN